MELGFTDPFSSQIDEFLAEKGGEKKDDDTPEDDITDKMAEEGVPEGKTPKQDAPEEEIKDKMAQEGVPEGKTPEQKAPQDKLEDKLEVEDPGSVDADLEQQVHSTLVRLAKEAERRNYPILSKKLLNIASPEGHANIINELLARENRILRFLELCHHVFCNPNHRLAFEVINKQKATSKEWRDFLTMKVIEAGGTPTVDHAAIVAPAPLDVESLLKLEISLLQEDLVAYKQALSTLPEIHQELQTAMTLKAGIITDLERALKAG
jgi:hypothetical protein